jgi:hypothetical protein
MRCRFLVGGGFLLTLRPREATRLVLARPVYFQGCARA